MRGLLFGILVLHHPFLCAQAQGESEEIRSWRKFTHDPATAGVEILSTCTQPQAIEKAEGFLYLLQQLWSTIQAKLVEQPGQIPLLRAGATTINKCGLEWRLAGN